MMSRIRGAVAAPSLGVLALSAVLLSCNAYAGYGGARHSGAPAPPIVKITAPANDSTHDWGSLVSYGIVVTYAGKSTRYQEIPSKDVLLRVAYVPGVARMAGKPLPAAIAAPAGLRDIIESNCLGCHTFRARAMGPSFAAIARRYADNPAAVIALSQHIRSGSTGVWGQASMPSHAQLTRVQLHDIVLWILQDAANPDVSYYVGTQGAFRMPAPRALHPSAAVILTASYTSPVPGGNPQQAARGEDTVIVRGK
ncbi:MAG: hypothetical protein HIU85_20275 [Proteobacteria bacterium]|nr:hypothetical protein [Pseudomonadota bacterium]